MEEGDGGELSARVRPVGARAVATATRDNYLDLDPTYKDRHGRPLLRMTFDFPDNELQDVGTI